MADNDDQAAKLIAALAPKIAEAILPQIAESVEAQMKGLKDKNDELLDKLAKQKASDDNLKSMQTLLAGLDAKDKQERLDKGTMQFDREGQDIRISKVDARDPRKYHAAKKLAGERGVDLVIDRDAS
ncbi:MAG: hypothetical protein H6901_02820 [Rhodobacteraceae bacterium]|nr:hypothetical protein [Paracoccaceae bacterium]